MRKNHGQRGPATMRVPPSYVLEVGPIEVNPNGLRVAYMRSDA